ncbi:hypothetical protein O181_126496 [Austropuccinia psidii MF-1]|uniref:Uncharacterized protein n=1 Tax=Austropuccinia psidii MF-1 TaxID=1389203 RepID=A0A9Q3KV60_9BASI|nr:hypothetical protein [Austropuccinia psidii MF-1]
MYCKGKAQQIKALLKNQSMVSEAKKKKLAQGKDNSPVEAPQAFKSKNPPQKVPKKGQENPKEQSAGQEKGKGKGQVQVEQALPEERQNSQEREDSHGKCVQYGKNSDGIQKEGGGKNEPILSKEIDVVKLLNHFETCNKEIIESKFTLINQPDDNSISFTTKKLRESRIQVLNLENSTGHSAALFQQQLGKRDKARLELNKDIKSSINNISLNNEFPRQSTPIHDINVLSLNNDLHHTISSNAGVDTACSLKDIPRLEEWKISSGEEEYNHMEFMKTIDMFKEDVNIPY